FRPDGQALLFAPNDGPLVVIDPGGRQPPREIMPWAVRSWPVLSPDAKRLAVSQTGGINRLWNLTTGKELPTFDDHRDGDPIEPMPSPDGRRVATVSRWGL